MSKSKELKLNLRIVGECPNLYLGAAYSFDDCFRVAGNTSYHKKTAIKNLYKNLKQTR